MPAGWVSADTSVLAAGQAAIGAGNLVLVKEKLKKMNELLQKAIDDYKNDVIEEDELIKRILEIKELKRDAIGAFPADIWGHSFSDWYHRFKLLDGALEYAYSRAYNPWVSEAETISPFEWAKEDKDELEAALPKK